MSRFLLTHAHTHTHARTHMSTKQQKHCQRKWQDIKMKLCKQWHNKHGNWPQLVSQVPNISFTRKCTTHLMCGRIFNDNCATNLRPSLTAKNWKKTVSNWRSCTQEYSGTILTKSGQRPGLWKLYLSTGTDSPCITVLAVAAYWGPNFLVDFLSKEQEYALSPMLFVIIMDVVTEQLHEGLSTLGSTVCGRPDCRK